LNTTNKRITEIAFEAGFGTYQNFNRVFKDAMGCTPKEYRARSVDNT
jgi:AraC-like DNA-binding protein